MKISVLGLGYVGAVSAGCLARDGHEVVGVIETHIGQIIAEEVAAGRLRAIDEVSEAVRHEGNCW